MSNVAFPESDSPILSWGQESSETRKKLNITSHAVLLLTATQKPAQNQSCDAEWRAGVVCYWLYFLLGFEFWIPSWI